jgi:hypothetical protein
MNIDGIRLVHTGSNMNRVGGSQGRQPSILQAIIPIKRYGLPLGVLGGHFVRSGQDDFDVDRPGVVSALLKAAAFSEAITRD